MSRPSSRSLKVRYEAWFLYMKRPEKAAEILVAAVKLTELSLA